MRRNAFLLVPLAALVLAACAGGTDKSDDARTVEVRMFDDMRYDPAEFEFTAGEIVRFEVINDGAVPHELFIGTTAEHEAHAAEMREAEHADDAHDDPAAVTVAPGETGSLTYTFAEAGELLAACHEPGHYEAGMVAPITVHP